MPDLNQDPGRLNCRCNQGDDFAFNLYFVDSVAGYTWEAKVDESMAIGIAAIASTDLPAGYASGLTLSLADTDTDDLTLGSHHWALDRTDAGSERRWLAGDFYIFQYNP